jgi:hypothetical protein
MGEFEQPIDFLLKDDNEALGKWCFNRCYQAFSVIYEYEQAQMGQFWRFDAGYYEHGIMVLYERFCYAAALIVDRFNIEWGALRDANDPRFMNLNDAHGKTVTFQVFLSGIVDEVFKHGARELGWSDATIEYCDQDYLSNEYEMFWEQHRILQSKIRSVRNSFAPEEKTYLNGFAEDDDDDENWNRDCLHMMRVCRISGDLDINMYLSATKRFYLPTIIGTFRAAPVTDLFVSKNKTRWWNIWKK